MGGGRGRVCVCSGRCVCGVCVLHAQGRWGLHVLETGLASDRGGKRAKSNGAPGGTRKLSLPWKVRCLPCSPGARTASDFVVWGGDRVWGAPNIRLISSAEVVSLSPSIPGPLPPASLLPWQPSPPESWALGTASPWGVLKAGPPCLPGGVQFSPCPAPRQPVSLVGWRGPLHSPSPRQETRRPDLPRFLKNKRHVSSQHPGRTLPARLRSCQGQPPNYSPKGQCVFGGSERHWGPSERCFCSTTAGVKCQLSPAHTMLLARALLVPNGDLQSGLEDRWKCRGTLIYGETRLVSAPWHHLCGAPCREATSSLLSEAPFLILCLFFLSSETGAGDRPVHWTTWPVHPSLRVRGAP